MFSTLFDLASRFGVLDAVANQLLSNPDQAAEKLGAVLAELVRTAEALDAEMVRYLSLYFHSPESISEGRSVLLGMEVGRSIIRINEARGHCHRIRHIYDQHLGKWFDRVFSDSAERNQLRTTFEGLGTADDYMIFAMREVAGWLETNASHTLDLVDAYDLPGANRRIHQARLEAKPARLQLVHLAARLRELETSFLHAARIS